MDYKSSKILSQYQENLVKSSFNSDDENDQSDIDSLLELLDDEDDPVMARYREQRVQQLNQEIKNSQDRVTDSSTVETLTSEVELFQLTTGLDSSVIKGGAKPDSKFDTSTALSSSSGPNLKIRSKYRSVIVHFFQPTFRTCKLVDECFTKLARSHFNTTKFVRIDAARDAPFLSQKFNISVLPTVLCFTADAVGTAPKMSKKFTGLDEFLDSQTRSKLIANPQAVESLVRQLDAKFVESVLMRVGALYRSSVISNTTESIAGSNNSISGPKIYNNNPNNDSDDDDLDI